MLRRVAPIAATIACRRVAGPSSATTRIGAQAATAAAITAVGVAHQQLRSFAHATRVLRSGADEEGPHGKIHVLDSRGNPIPNHQPLHEYAEIFPRVPQWVADGVQHVKYVKPTPVQSHTVPFVLDGQDVVGLAPTGSGKTAAFAVPSLAQLTFESRGSARRPQILVLCPVRELAQQTAKVFRDLCFHNRDVSICEAFGGSPRGPQEMAIRRGCDVLVATPGRLVDFLESRVVDARGLKFWVLDEADRMLDMGFSRDMENIASFLPRQRQTMMWSATWPREVQALASNYLAPERALIRVGDGGQMVNKNITQHVFYAQHDDERMSKLAKLYTSGRISPTDKALMFVKRKDQCEAIAAEIASGLQAVCGADPRTVAPIHGGMQQFRRDDIMKKFKAGQIKILVATDVAARGLDFPDIEYVVNYDAPHDIDSYTHRIGRTGRNGRKGVSFTFLMPDTLAVARDVKAFMLKCGQEISQELEDAVADFRPKTSRFGRGRGRGGGGRGYGGGRGGGGGYGDRQPRQSSEDYGDTW